MCLCRQLPGLVSVPVRCTQPHLAQHRGAMLRKSGCSSDVGYNSAAGQCRGGNVGGAACVVDGCPSVAICFGCVRRFERSHQEAVPTQTGHALLSRALHLSGSCTATRQPARHAECVRHTQSQEREAKGTDVTRFMWISHMPAARGSDFLSAPDAD